MSGVPSCHMVVLGHDRQGNSIAHVTMWSWKVAGVRTGLQVMPVLVLDHNRH